MSEALRKLETALYATANRGGGGELVQRDDWVQLTTPDAQTDYRNGIFRSVLEPEDAERRVDETLAWFGEIGVAFRWWITPSTRPEDLGDLLVRKGFRLADRVDAMIARPQDFAPPSGGRIEVTRIGPDGIGEWLATSTDGWGFPPGAVERFRRELARELDAPAPRALYFLARVDGVRAGTCSLKLVEDFAHFHGSVVLKELRRQGVYREMILERMRVLRERGIRLVTNHCVRETSAPICRKLGFETVSEFLVYRSP